MIASSLLTALALQAAAPAEPPPSSGEEVLVTGRADALERFVEELAAAPRLDQIARWHDHICPRAIGVSDGQASYLVARMRSIARDHDVPVARGRCQSNIFVFITDQADEVAALIARRHPRLLWPSEHAPPKRADVAAWLQPRAVRRLHATRLDYAGMGLAAESSQRSLSVALMIVDATRLGQATWGQLAAHLSLQALTRSAKEPDVGSQASIIGLFEGGADTTRSPPGLSRSDSAFLRALYSGAANLRAARHRSRIQQRMARTLAADPTGDAPAGPVSDQRE